MKMIKRTISMLLVSITLIIIFPSNLVTQTNTTVKAATIRLNKSFVKLSPDETFDLKMLRTKDKVTFTSNDANVATVSNKGKITAKNVGDTYVYAKVGKEKLGCRVSVRHNPSIELKKVTQEFCEIQYTNRTVIKCIFTNNSDMDFESQYTITFFNAAGEKVSLISDNYVMLRLLRGQSTAITFDAPNKEYAYYTVQFTKVYEDFYYYNMQKYITIEPKEVVRSGNDFETRGLKDFKYIDLAVNNTSEKNVDFIAYIKFYKNDKLVDVQTQYKILDINDNYIENRDYAPDFDRYEVVMSARVKKY